MIQKKQYKYNTNICRSHTIYYCFRHIFMCQDKSVFNVTSFCWLNAIKFVTKSHRFWINFSPRFYYVSQNYCKIANIKGATFRLAPAETTGLATQRPLMSFSQKANHLQELLYSVLPEFSKLHASMICSTITLLFCMQVVLLQQFL